MTLEERIAQLERIMLAQVSSQESEGYYMSKYSGEEIDALLDKVKAMDEGGG